MHASADPHRLRPHGGAATRFKWVNTALGNIETAIYRATRQQHIPRYLAEFAYRFDRRYDLAAMTPRLGWAAVRTPPMPYPSSNWLRLMRNEERRYHGLSTRTTGLPPRILTPILGAWQRQRKIWQSIKTI